MLNYSLTTKVIKQISLTLKLSLTIQKQGTEKKQN